MAADPKQGHCTHDGQRNPEITNQRHRLLESRDQRALERAARNLTLALGALTQDERVDRFDRAAAEHLNVRPRRLIIRAGFVTDDSVEVHSPVPSSCSWANRPEGRVATVVQRAEI